MDESVIAQLGVIVAEGGPRIVRAGRAADLIRQATSARWVGIYTVTGAVIACDAWSGPCAPAYPSFAVTEVLTATAVRTGSVALSNDVSHDPRYLANQDDSGSELIVPVRAGGHTVGTLDVEGSRTGAFGGSSILEYEPLAAALCPLWDQPWPVSVIRSCREARARELAPNMAQAGRCCSPDHACHQGWVW